MRSIIARALAICALCVLATAGLPLRLEACSLALAASGAAKPFPGPLSPKYFDMTGVEKHPHAHGRPNDRGGKGLLASMEEEDAAEAAKAQKAKARAFSEMEEDEDESEAEARAATAQRTAAAAAVREAAKERAAEQADRNTAYVWSAFLAVMAKTPLDGSKAERLCNEFPKGSPIPNVPRVKVPPSLIAAAVEQGLLDVNASRAPSFPAHVLLTAAMPHAPEAIGALACLAEKGILQISALPDGGGRLIYVAAAWKHLRLLSLLLGQAAEVRKGEKGDAAGGRPASYSPVASYYDHSTGFSVVHAAIEHGVLLLDIATSLLRGHVPSKGADGALLSAANAAAAYPRWLGKLVDSMVKHLPAVLSGDIKDALAKVLAPSPLLHANGTLRTGYWSSSARPPPKGSSLLSAPIATLSTVHTEPLGVLANGMATLTLRLVVEEAIAAAAAAAGAAHAARVAAGHDVPGSPLYGPTAPGFASGVYLTSLLEARDKRGRTPLHIAAAGGNDAAISHLFLALHRGCASIWVHVNASAPASRPPPPRDGILASFAARYATLPDALGWTPRALACTRAHMRAAAVLYAAELAWSKPGSKPREADACVGVAGPKATGEVGDEGGSARAVHVPHSRRGAQGWEGVRGSPAPPAAAALAHAVRRAWARAEGSTAPDALATCADSGTAGLHADGSPSRCPGSAAMPSTCEIAVVDAAALTAPRFLSLYAAKGVPVLVRGGPDGEEIVRRWSMDALLARAGGEAWEASGIPYARSFGVPPAALNLTLASYVRALTVCGQDNDPSPADAALCQRFNSPTGDAKSGAPAYLFGSPLETTGARSPTSAAAEGLELIPSFMRVQVPRWDSEKGPVLLSYVDELAGGGAVQAVMAAHPRPPTSEGAGAGSDPLVFPSPPPRVQVYVGGPGTGAPLHFHKDAWNALAAGVKRWYLLPPAAAVYSTQAAADFVLSLSEGSEGSGKGAGRSGTEGALRECTQLPGDILYVPFGWAHAVLNMGTAVGVAVEYSSPLAPLARSSDSVDN